MARCALFIAHPFSIACPTHAYFHAHFSCSRANAKQELSIVNHRGNRWGCPPRSFVSCRRISSVSRSFVCPLPLSWWFYEPTIRVTEGLGLWNDPDNSNFSDHGSKDARTAIVDHRFTETQSLAQHASSASACTCYDCCLWRIGVRRAARCTRPPTNLYLSGWRAWM